MDSDWIRVMAVAGLMLWMLFTWRGGRLLVREIRRSLDANRFVDALAVAGGFSANLLNIAYELGQRVWALPNYDLNLPGAVRLAGLALFTISFAWVVWARRILGRGWSVLPQDSHMQLYTNGPYSVVRHPIYAGAALAYAGLLLAQNNITGQIIFGSQIVGFVVKAAWEDQFLSLEKGLNYQDYKNRVKWRLFPGLW
ncbi:MAG TPA: methyltransferase [Blastocatellia bacterium]|nr:methyltransferase [Blastocatellia bacterium]